MDLDADQEYLELSEEQKRKQLNGCGPKALEGLPWFERIALDRDDFLESCRIHDWDFEFSPEKPSKEHLKKSNRRLLENMKKEAASKSSLWKRLYLYAKAYLYFALCDLFGGSFYKWER